jgi:hypothetical protein
LAKGEWKMIKSIDYSETDCKLHICSLTKKGMVKYTYNVGLQVYRRINPLYNAYLEKGGDKIQGKIWQRVKGFGFEKSII